MRTTFGCRSSATVRPSSRNISTNSGLFVNWGSIRLTITTSPVVRSRAAHTSAIPPEASGLIRS